MRPRLVLAAAVLAAAPVAAPAHADLVGVGADFCTAQSAGFDAECIAVVTGGFYRLEAVNIDSEGSTHASVGCNPSGAGGAVSASGELQTRSVRVYLPTGICTLHARADVFGTGWFIKE